MSELTIRLACAAVGLAVGLILGWTSRAARDARDVRKTLMTKEDGARPSTWSTRTRPRVRVTRSDVLLGLLIIIALASSVTAWQTNERVERVSECTASVTARLVEAANERTTYSSESARANAELQHAQRDMLGVMLSGAERPERVQALQDYAKALDRFEAVQAKAARKRRDNPYPTEGEIAKCR